jgi:hypothetical protein
MSLLLKIENILVNFTDKCFSLYYNDMKDLKIFKLYDDKFKNIRDSLNFYL